MGEIKTIEMFTETVKAMFEKHFATEETKVKIEKVLKPNNSIFTGIYFLHNEENISPLIYLESYFDRYKEGESIENICSQILEIYNAHKKNVFDFSLVTNLNRARNSICYKVINAKENKALLKEVPHKQFLDLAIIFQIIIQQDEENTDSAIIKNPLLEKWNIETDELYEIAKENTQKLYRGKVIAMSNLLKAFFLEDTDDYNEDSLYDIEINSDELLFVCTNSHKKNGAGVIFYEGLLETVSEKLNSDFYILPSSVHEVIFVPAIGADIEMLKEIVKNVNSTEVTKEDFLSNNVYYYNHKTAEVKIA